MEEMAAKGEPQSRGAGSVVGATFVNVEQAARRSEVSFECSHMLVETAPKSTGSATCQMRKARRLSTGSRVALPRLAPRGEP